MTIFSSKELELTTNALDQDEYVRFFQGTRNAQLFTLALFTWFAYEYVVTFINEVTLFWVDREWTRGRGLFFINRYTTWLAMIPSLYVALVPNPSLAVCIRSIHILLVTNIICITIGQAYISNKFWNIFELRQPIRISLAIGLGLSTVLSLVLLSFSDSHLTIVRVIDHPLAISNGCKVYPPKRFWITYVPLLLFHGYLYFLAVYTAFRNRDLWKISESTRKVFWDGTIIFFIFLVTSLCVIIFSSRTSILWLSIPMTLGPIPLIATSITLSRRAIATRMFLERSTDDFASQDTMSHAIELMPFEAR